MRLRDVEVKCAGCGARLVFVPPVNRGLLLTGKPDNVTHLPPPGPHYCDHCERTTPVSQRP